MIVTTFMAVVVHVPMPETGLLVFDAMDCAAAQSLGSRFRRDDGATCELLETARLDPAWVSIGNPRIRSERLMAVRKMN